MKLLLVSPSRKFGKKVLTAIKIRQLGLHILAVDECVPVRREMSPHWGVK